MEDGGAAAALPARGASGDHSLSRTRAPARLPGLVDSHCHLQAPAFDADREAVIARAVEAGIERILVPGYDLVSSRAAVALAVAHPELIDAAVGVHPHFASAPTAADWDELAALAAAPRVVAVGEIGLDFHRDLSPRDAQRSALTHQLAIAAAVGKPVLVHDREAHDDVRAALLGWDGPGAGRLRGVLHCFSGDAALAQDLAGGGYLISFALPVSFSSTVGPRAAAVALPEGTYLVETDSPWLAPGGGEQRNEPTTALRVAAELARLRGTTAEAIAAGVADAYRRLVGALRS
ncbi:MAG: TatD family hydrolase [Candidatus Limnocylindria bacterium]